MCERRSNGPARDTNTQELMPVNYILLPLSNSDTQFIKISPEDVNLCRHRWHINDDGYACTNVRNSDGPGHHAVKIHQMILDIPQDLEGDHRNHDKLDNRRPNLRISTRAGNVHNRRAYAGHFKGVFQKRDYKNRWFAHCGYKNKPHYLGSYSSEIDAALAYDAAAALFHGPFAALNFPNDTPLSLAEALSMRTTHVSKPLAVETFLLESYDGPVRPG